MRRIKFDRNSTSEPGLKGLCMFESRNTQVYALPPCYKLNRQLLGLTISRQLTQGTEDQVPGKLKDIY